MPSSIGMYLATFPDLEIDEPANRFTQVQAGTPGAAAARYAMIERANPNDALDRYPRAESDASLGDVFENLVEVRNSSTGAPRLFRVVCRRVMTATITELTDEEANVSV